MQILQNPDHEIGLDVATATATLNPCWAASWVEFSGPTIENPQLDLYSDSASISGGASAVIIPGPTVGNNRQIKQIIVHNPDSISHDVTIQLGPIPINLIVVTLAAGDHLIYEDAKGWYVIDSGGCIKTYQCNSSGGGGATSLGLFATGNTTQGSTGTAALSSLLFNGAGNVSVGFSNGSIVISGGTAAPSPVIFSAGTSSASLGSVVFSDSNRQSFGLNGSTITGSWLANAIGSNGNFNFQVISFTNANGISFGTSAGSAIFASYTVPTVTNSSWTVSDNATSGTVARLAFTNINGITLGLSTTTGGSHTIFGSHNGLTSQSNQNAIASNGNFNFQTISFTNANNISFGTSAGSAIFASYSQSNQQMTFFATGNTVNTTSGTINASSIIVRGSGVASVGITNGSIVVDVPAGGGAAERAEFCVPWQGSVQTSAFENGSFRIQPYNGPPLIMDRLVQYVSYSQATDSTCSGTMSIWCQIFTKNASTLSAFTSGSTTYGWTGPGTQSSTLYMGGMRAMSCPLSATLSSGKYWIGILMRSTTGGANASISNVNVSQFSQSFKGDWGVGSNGTAQLFLGHGWLTASTSTTRDSIAFSHISFNAGFRQDRYIMMVNGTL